MNGVADGKLGLADVGRSLVLLLLVIANLDDAILAGGEMARASRDAARERRRPVPVDLLAEGGDGGEGERGVSAIVSWAG